MLPKRQSDQETASPSTSPAPQDRGNARPHACTGAKPSGLLPAGHATSRWFLPQIQPAACRRSDRPIAVASPRACRQQRLAPQTLVGGKEIAGVAEVLLRQ
jgi:hypothetical protein